MHPTPPADPGCRRLRPVGKALGSLPGTRSSRRPRPRRQRLAGRPGCHRLTRSSHRRAPFQLRSGGRFPAPGRLPPRGPARTEARPPAESGRATGSGAPFSSLSRCATGWPAGRRWGWRSVRRPSNPPSGRGRRRADPTGRPRGVPRDGVEFVLVASGSSLPRGGRTGPRPAGLIAAGLGGARLGGAAPACRRRGPSGPHLLAEAASAPAGCPATCRTGHPGRAGRPARFDSRAGHGGHRVRAEVGLPAGTGIAGPASRDAERGRLHPLANSQPW